VKNPASQLTIQTADNIADIPQQSFLAENIEIPLDYSSDKKNSVALNIFWTGFVIYSASFAISTTTTVNYIFCQAFQIIGLILIVSASIKLLQWKFDNTYLKTFYIIYCSWLLIVIFRGFIFDYGNMKFMLFDAEFGLFRYFVPLILLFPKNLIFYKKVFKVIVILGLVFIFYDIVFRSNLLDLNYTNNNTKFTFEYFAKILGLPAGFLLLTYNYQSNMRKLIAIVIIAVGVGFSILRARRALLFMTITPLVISYLLYLYQGRKKILIIVFSIFIGVFAVLYGIKVYNDNRNGMFYLITERINENTRSAVETNFYYDMTTQDWIIGKGINGQYFSPGIDLGDTSGYRSMIETDYLNIILKGGIISMLLLFMIAIPAVILGLFFSKNLLSKAAAFWIVLWLAELYPANVNSFSMNHLLVWISIGICYSKEIRNQTESFITEVLYK
jgi:hypothetical protein